LSQILLVWSNRQSRNVGKIRPAAQPDGKSKTSTFLNVDFTGPMLEELDDEARALNISCQAVIKSLLRQALDRQKLARKAG